MISARYHTHFGVVAYFNAIPSKLLFFSENVSLPVNILANKTNLMETGAYSLKFKRPRANEKEFQPLSRLM